MSDTKIIDNDEKSVTQAHIDHQHALNFADENKGINLEHGKSFSAFPVDRASESVGVGIILAHTYPATPSYSSPIWLRIQSSFELAI